MATPRVATVDHAGRSQVELLVGRASSLEVRFAAPLDDVALWLETLDGERVGRPSTRPRRSRVVFHIPRGEYRVVLERAGLRLERIVHVAERFATVDFR